MRDRHYHCSAFVKDIEIVRRLLGLYAQRRPAAFHRERPRQATPASGLETLHASSGDGRSYLSLPWVSSSSDARFCWCWGHVAVGLTSSDLDTGEPHAHIVCFPMRCRAPDSWHTLSRSADGSYSLIVRVVDGTTKLCAISCRHSFVAKLCPSPLTTVRGNSFRIQ